MFEKIIVAVDGSKQSDRALEVACDIAKKYAAKLHIVHSPQMETTAIAVGSGAVEIRPDAEAIAAAGQAIIDRTNKMAISLGCEPTECLIGNHDPAEEILQYIEKLDADLVVMGRRGLGSIASLVLGSVSQKVSHNAECTCMTVS